MTVVHSTVRETSSPADSVTVNLSSDSGVVSCVREMFTAASLAPCSRVNDPLVLFTSIPSVNIDDFCKRKLEKNLLTKVYY